MFPKDKEWFCCFCLVFISSSSFFLLCLLLFLFFNIIYNYIVQIFGEWARFLALCLLKRNLFSCFSPIIGKFLLHPSLWLPRSSSPTMLLPILLSSISIQHDSCIIEKAHRCHWLPTFPFLHHRTSSIPKTCICLSAIPVSSSNVCDIWFMTFSVPIQCWRRWLLGVDGNVAPYLCFFTWGSILRVSLDPQ